MLVHLKPARTGAMEFMRMVNDNMTEKSLTILTTGRLDVKMRESFSWKSMIIEANSSPANKEVRIETVVANLAAFALPAPSSFATRTLHHHRRDYDRVSG